MTRNMIREEGVVMSAGPAGVDVETQRRATCDACQVSPGCGTAVLQRALGNRRNRVRAPGTLPVQPGERVIVALEGAALLRGSLAVYGAPLAGLFSGASAAAWIQGLAGATGDWPAVAGAALGLACGFAWVRRFSGKITRDPRYQPVIVGRMGNQATVSAVLTTKPLRNL